MQCWFGTFSGKSNETQRYGKLKEAGREKHKMGKDKRESKSQKVK
jgi:hypothetical protein